MKLPKDNSLTEDATDSVLATDYRVGRDISHDYYGAPRKKPNRKNKSTRKNSRTSKRPIQLRKPEEFPDDYYTKDEVAYIRSTISKKLDGIARYVEIKSGTKIAVNNFSDENSSRTIPESGDYGIIPKKNLFVLDIDSHAGSGISVDAQIDIFSELLGINLRNTLAVSTPSGGFHAYMLAPVDADNLQSGLQNLNSYSDAISEILGRPVVVDADIRTGKSAGYTVGPTSISLTVKPPAEGETEEQRILGFYKIADESHGFSVLSNNAELLTMSKEGFERFARLKDLKQDLADEEIRVRRAERAAARQAMLEKRADARELEPSRDTYFADGSIQLDSAPPTDLLRKLEKEMIARNMVTFHQKRSFVKAALHCCHTDSAIAQVCIDFQIDRDSGSQDTISYKDLMIDLHRFTPSIRFHGGYCSYSQHETKKAHMGTVVEGKVFDLEEFKALTAERVANRKIARHEFGYRGSITPRVLDTSVISQRLMEGSRRKTASKQYLDAMAIVDYFLQPLSNVGSKTILLARSAIETRLELSPSRASQALRILREKGIITVSDKQKTGMAATYFVNDEFTHARLTKTLKMLWGFNGVPLGTGEIDSDGNLKKFHANLYLDRFSGVFREVFTEKIVESNFALVVKWIQSMNESTLAPALSDFGPGAAPSYLKKEAKDRGLKVIGGSETVIFEENTGELVNHSADSRSESMKEKFGQKASRTESPISSSVNRDRSSSSSVNRVLAHYSIGTESGDPP
jgi:DNA-binding transcriptional ArsR family regulator